MESDGRLELTEEGKKVAGEISERHRLLTGWLVSLGVPEEIAKGDACKIEHDLSEESFAAICSQIV